MPFAANVAVEIAGVCVIPGDYIYADASGAVVIPQASLQQVIEEALTVEAEDARSLRQIERGDGATRSNGSIMQRSHPGRQ